MDKTQPHPLFKLATELGPLIVFFVANAKFHLFVATGAFMVAIVAAMVASYVVTRHVPLMALVTGIVVLVFGTLTLVLHDETFIKLKPTIIYSLFALVLRRRTAVRPLLHRHHVRPDVQPDAEGLAHPHHALGAVLRGAGGSQRDRLAHPEHRLLGELQGVRRHAADHGASPSLQMPLIKRYHIEPASLEASEAEPRRCEEGVTPIGRHSGREPERANPESRDSGSASFARVPE